MTRFLSWTSVNKVLQDLSQIDSTRMESVGWEIQCDSSFVARKYTALMVVIGWLRALSFESSDFTLEAVLCERSCATDELDYVNVLPTTTPLEILQILK